MISDCLIDPIKQLFIDPIVRCIKSAIVDPLERNIRYPFTYQTNIENLRKQVHDLTPVRDDLQRDCNQVKQSGDGINSTVQTWLDDAQRALQNAQKVIEEEDGTCCNGKIPNLWKRRLLSRKAEDESKVLQKLQDHIPNLGEISFRLKLEASSSAHGDEHLESRSSILEQVLTALADPQINVVGVWGMGGVGKTTLAEHVKKQAKQANSYGLLFMATVSPTPDLDSIQQQLAEMVGLTIQEKTSEGKALRMEQTLIKTERILIILDDVWERFPFEKIGIPHGSYHKGCKLLLTSRSQRVLFSMGAQSFKLDLLSEREAWSLFSRTVGEFTSDEVRELATKVAEKCAGLPLLIDTAAKALKDGEIHEWRNALKKLSSIDEEKGSLEDSVYPVLELSYCQLRDNEIKTFFLLCGQLGRSNILIEDLLKYSIALDLLQGSDETMEDRRDTVLTWISRLKAYSLLLDSNFGGYIKIHDLVRDTALKISSKNQHVLAVKSGAPAFTEWPKEEVLKNSTTICLPHCDFQDLPGRFESPEAKFLMLGFNYHSLRIPDIFFESVKKLKVLHFSKIIFPSLPKSLGSLVTLCTLYFDQCELHDVAIIGELKDLEILSFAGCIIRHLPEAIGQLSRLKLLDLSNCTNLKSIPPNVLSSLYELEELYMIGSFSNWDEIGKLNNQRNASISELDGLSHLATLEIVIPRGMTLPKVTFFKNLARYKLVIGGFPKYWNWYVDPKLSRTLDLSIHKSIYKERWLGELVKKTENLFLEVADGIRELSVDQGGIIFPQLQNLCLGRAKIQYIVNTSRMGVKAFPILKFMCLTDMPMLEKICQGPIANGSFKDLTTLKIEYCNNLKNLFSLSVVRGISRLQTLQVRNCDGLKYIIVNESDDESADHEEVSFPHLYELKLKWLPQLQGFCSEKIRASDDAGSHGIVSEVEMEVFFNKMVAFPVLEKLVLRNIANNTRRIWQQGQLPADSFGKVKSIEIGSCNELDTVFPFGVVERFFVLEELSLSNCSSLQHICQLQEEMMTKETAIFPSLKTIMLDSLESFSSVYYPRNVSFQCPGLKKITISNCPAMSTEQIEQQPTTSVFDHKVSPSLEDLSLDHTAAKMILQPQLSKEFLNQIKILELEDFLKRRLSLSIIHQLPNLEKLHLSYFSLKEELFPSKELGIGKEDGALRPLEGIRDLKLSSIYDLEHIWNQDFQLYPFLEYLEILSVGSKGVISLASSPATFRNLTTLHVNDSYDLINLVTLSVAKSMVRLTKMMVGNCDKLIEIVADEQGESGSADEEIVFEKLKILELYNLKVLKCFSSSNCTFKFPSLEQLTLECCPKMEVFTNGELITEKLKRVLLSTYSMDNWRRNDNLNDTIKEIYAERSAMKRVSIDY